jgi:hypothetical protein
VVGAPVGTDEYLWGSMFLMLVFDNLLCCRISLRRRF